MVATDILTARNEIQKSYIAILLSQKRIYFYYNVKNKILKIYRYTFSVRRF